MSQPNDGALGRAKISMTGVLAQSVGFMGPVFSVATLLPLVVGLSATGRGAGVATPIAIFIAGLGMFGAGWVIAQYAKRIQLCGSLYEYICDAFGPRVGVVAGWGYYGAMLVLGAATFLILGGMTQDFLLTAFSVDLPWWPISLAFVVAVVSVVIIGVQISVRAQLALVLISLGVVLIFSLYIIFKGGLGGHSLSAAPLNPLSVGGLDLLYGVLYGINMFIGYESAANLAEETDNPKRHIPRAVLWSLTIVGVYYLITAYAQAVGFGLDGEAWKASVFPLQVLASGHDFGSTGFGNVMAVLIILDVVAVAIGVGVAATRGMLGMARAGRLPSALARLHPRFGTPVVGAALFGVVSVAAILIVRFSDGLFSRATGGTRCAGAAMGSDVRMDGGLRRHRTGPDVSSRQRGGGVGAVEFGEPGQAGHRGHRRHPGVRRRGVRRAVQGPQPTEHRAMGAGDLDHAWCGVGANRSPSYTSDRERARSVPGALR